MAPMQETGLQSLGQEDPLEKETATHCSILAREVTRTEEPGRLKFTGSQSRMCVSGLRNNKISKHHEELTELPSPKMVHGLVRKLYFFVFNVYAVCFFSFLPVFLFFLSLFFFSCSPIVLAGTSNKM